MDPGVHVVAFSGVDGAGKSSQVARLVEGLRGAGVDPVVFWMPLGHSRLQRRLSTTARRILRAGPRSGAGPQPNGDRAKAIRLRRPFLTAAWTTLIASNHALTYRRVVAQARRQGHSVVLFDRYALDALAQMRYYYGDGRWYALHRLLLTRFAPRAEHAYLLDVDPETALARKQEQHTLEQLRRQRELLRAEASGLGVEILEGGLPAEILAARIAADVLGGATVKP